MPSIKFLVSKYTTYCFKLVAVILLLGKIIPSCFCYTEKGLVYIAIIALFSRQPFSCVECTKLNIHLSYNICLISNDKYIFFARFYTL